MLIFTFQVRVLVEVRFKLRLSLGLGEVLLSSYGFRLGSGFCLG